MNNGQSKQLDLTSLPLNHRKEVEEFVVNSVKINLIRKFENILETPGKSNLRQLFLVPLFTVSEMTDRVSKNAPQLLTVYYKELFAALDDAGTKLS